MSKPWLAVAITGLAFTATSSIASAAEIKCLCPLSMKGAMPEVVAQFERSSGHKVMIEYATVGAIVERLQKGDTADLAIVSGPRFEELQKQGKFAASTRTDVARVGVGLFVRAGAPKPDIATVDAFKRTLQNAKAVSYGDPAGGGVSGVHMASLVERLGIAEALKPKTKLLLDSQAVLTAVAQGEVEIGIGLTSDATLVPGVELAGALPTEIQNFTLYAAGIASGGKETDASKAFIKFFSSEAGHAILKVKGFQPL